MKQIALVTLILSLFTFADAYAEDGPNVYQVLQYERTIDGDTFVASGKKIRMWGIDAPEKDHPASYAATLLLKNLIKDGELRCKFIEKDRYKRDVMHCLIDNSDLGSMMVQTGMAQDFKKYSGGYYNFEEELAKEKQIGIWKNPLSDRL